jgi:hypothetical protein
MPGLPIVVDVGITEPQRDLLGVLLGACSQAAADSQCYLVSEAPEGPYRAIAIVTWEREDRVRVEVGVRRTEGGEWRTRQLSFQPADESLERYRSVGFVVGTLARDAPAAQADSALSEPPAPKKPQPERQELPKAPAPAVPEAPTPARKISGFLMPLALVAGALDEGGPRFGAGLRAGLRPHANWFLMAAVEGSFRPRAREVTLVWIDAGGGAGVRTTGSSPLHLELRVELLAEIFRAEAQAGWRGESRSRIVGATRGGADLVLDLSPSVGLAAGADAMLRFGSTDLRVGGENIGSTGSVDVGGMIGVRVEL